METGGSGKRYYWERFKWHLFLIALGIINLAVGLMMTGTDDGTVTESYQMLAFFLVIVGFVCFGFVALVLLFQGILSWMDKYAAEHGLFDKLND